MQDTERPVLSLVFIGSLLVGLVLGCSSLRQMGNTTGSNAGSSSPVASPTVATSTSASPSSNGSSPTSSPGVTLANFNRLKTGMTYAEVVAILGKEGKKTGDLGTKETAFKIQIYQWKGDGPDAEMTVFFKDGKLDNSSQFGLK